MLSFIIWTNLSCTLKALIVVMPDCVSAKCEKMGDLELISMRLSCRFVEIKYLFQKAKFFKNLKKKKFIIQMKFTCTARYATVIGTRAIKNIGVDVEMMIIIEVKLSMQSIRDFIE